MMEKFINYKGQKYPIKELTIKSWSSIMSLKDLLDEDEMYMKMLADMTGLKDADILEADASTMKELGDVLNDILNSKSKKLYPIIEFKDRTYTLVDVHNMSFGQFRSEEHTSELQSH